MDLSCPLRVILTCRSVYNTEVKHEIDMTKRQKQDYVPIYTIAIIRRPFTIWTHTPIILKRSIILVYVGLNYLTVVAYVDE